MRAVSLSLLLCVALSSACGGGGDDDDDDDTSGVDAAPVTCTLQATTRIDATLRIITGVSELACTGDASLTLEACLQWNANGEFEDVICQENTSSPSAELNVELSNMCGLVSSRLFRTRANATMNGTDLGEQISNTIACQ